MTIGLAEWVEENRKMLASRVVAYLNVNSAVHGPGFHASATRQLDELLKQATQQSTSIEIVKKMQEKKHICGMTGDGVNDAPAVKKANIGIAVADATDAAGGASDIVLTEPGSTILPNGPWL